MTDHDPPARHQAGSRRLRLRRPPRGWPWRPANRFTLHVDGTRYFPAMLDAIEAARRYVLVEIYLFESGETATRFIDALCGASARGIGIFMLLDAFGSRGLAAGDRQRLVDAGIHLAIFNPLHLTRPRSYLSRNHRKLLLVDGDLAFTGGFGITDEFTGHKAWRENAAEIRGPVTADWHALFLETWRRWSRVPLPPQPAPEPSGSMRGRVTATRAVRPVAITRSALRHALAARRQIWLATAYFVPSAMFRHALRRRARQGVDVRLLLPGPVTDHPAVRYAGRRFYARLLRAGVRIYEYQPRFTHQKVLLCDRWVAIGSSNLDRWNLRWNLEANQEIEDAGFAAQVGAMMAGDFHESREITLQAWQRRPLRDRLLEWLWGRIDTMLAGEE